MRFYLTKRAEKYYDKAPANLKAKFDDALNQLVKGRGDVKPLEGVPDVYRLHVGDYRIIFRPDMESQELAILKIAPRGDVYKD